MNPPSPTQTPRGRIKVQLSAEDQNWTAAPEELAAARVALTEVRTSARVQTAETIPWKDHVWEVLLPNASHFVNVWNSRHPHERSIGGQQRRSQDHYLVLLKRNILNKLFHTLEGEIMSHLCDPQSEGDALLRASVSRHVRSLLLPS